MRLYLVRHGEAKPKDADPERHLTSRGEADARRMAGFLKPLGLTVAEVWHSGKARARQTAEILTRALTVIREMLQVDGLGPLDDVRPVVEAIGRIDEDMMIVGHMPFQARLAGALLAGDAEKEFVGFTTVATACLDRDDDGRWHLAWLISPELIP